MEEDVEQSVHLGATERQCARRWVKSWYFGGPQGLEETPHFFCLFVFRVGEEAEWATHAS